MVLLMHEINEINVKRNLAAQKDLNYLGNC